MSKKISMDITDESFMKSPRPCGASLLWTWYSAGFDRWDFNVSRGFCIAK